MGQCQSRDGPSTLKSRITLENWKQGKSRASRRRRRRAEEKKGAYPETVSSPAEQTQPETPVSASPKLSPLVEVEDEAFSDSFYYNSPKTQEEEEEEYKQLASPLHIFMMEKPNLLVDEEAIPEEVDPDAPSDEEDFHGKVREAVGVRPGEWTQEPGPLRSPKKHRRRHSSPPRPQACVKARRKRITRPHSIVNRPDPPLISPPTKGKLAKTKTAVNPHTMAQFKKLKVQVKLADRQDRVKKRASKLEDRYEDIRGYRSLWNEYELIESQQKQRQAQSDDEAMDASMDTDTDVPAEATTRSRSHSFDLKETDSWYFDFQSLDGDADMDDNASQNSLSLLSTASMEAQRLLFAEKSKARQRNGSKKTKTKVAPEGEVSKARSDAGSVGGGSCSVATVEGDYGPVRRGGSVSGRSLTNFEISYSQSFGDDVSRSSNMAPDEYSQVSDLDNDDYGVRRKRRGRRSGYASSNASVSGMSAASVSAAVDDIERKLRNLTRPTPPLVVTTPADVPPSPMVAGNDDDVEDPDDTPQARNGHALDSTYSRDQGEIPANAVILESADPNSNVRWREFANEQKEHPLANSAKNLESLYAAESPSQNNGEEKQPDTEMIEQRLQEYLRENKDRGIQADQLEKILLSADDEIADSVMEVGDSACSAEPEENPVMERKLQDFLRENKNRDIQGDHLEQLLVNCPDEGGNDEFGADEVAEGFKPRIKSALHTAELKREIPQPLDEKENRDDIPEDEKEPHIISNLPTVPESDGPANPAFAPFEPKWLEKNSKVPLNRKEQDRKLNEDPTDVTDGTEAETIYPDVESESDGEKEHCPETKTSLPPPKAHGNDAQPERLGALRGKHIDRNKVNVYDFESVYSMTPEQFLKYSDSFGLPGRTASSEEAPEDEVLLDEAKATLQSHEVDPIEEKNSFGEIADEIEHQLDQLLEFAHDHKSPMRNRTHPEANPGYISDSSSEGGSDLPLEPQLGVAAANPREAVKSPIGHVSEPKGVDPFSEGYSGKSLDLSFEVPHDERCIPAPTPKIDYSASLSDDFMDYGADSEYAHRVADEAGEMLRQLERAGNSPAKYPALPQLPPPQDSEQLEKLHRETMVAIQAAEAAIAVADAAIQDIEA